MHQELSIQTNLRKTKKIYVSLTTVFWTIVFSLNVLIAIDILMFNGSLVLNVIVP